MCELNFKNYWKTCFLMLISIAALSGISLVDVVPVEIPVPVYILGILTGFLILSFVLYSKATIGQTLQISIAGILVNAVFITGIYFISSYSDLPEIMLKSEFVLSISPLLIAGSFVFSIIITCTALKLEEKSFYYTEEITEQKNSEEENKNNEEITENIPLVENEDLNHTEIVKLEISAKPEEQGQKKEEIETITHKQKTPSTYEELYPDGNSYVKPSEVQEEEIDFEQVPENDLKSTEESLGEIKEELPADEEIFCPANSGDNGHSEDMDFIPTNIRLSETSTSRETESKGRIASIGKLLVNNRDIENLIETNEAVEESVLNSRTNVISSISGEKIYNKFSEMKKEFVYIKEVALIDKGGFTLANDFEDKQKAQMTGALISGAYHTLQNYLTQIGLAFPVRIFFETADTNSFIVKTRDEILFSTWDKEFKHVEYGPLNEIIEAEDFSEVDITPFIDLINIEDFIVSDIDGNIVISLKNAEDSQKFAAVSSAVFENLKVFLMNIQLLKLSKIVIFTPKKTMTVAKTQDKIISFLTPQEQYPKISEDLLKIEEIY